MEDNTKLIRTFAFTGLLLHIIWTVLNVGVRIHPELVLQLWGTADLAEEAAVIRHPLFLIYPLVSLAVYVLFYYLLHAQIAAPTQFSGTLLGLVLGGTLALAVIQPVISSVTNILISRLMGAAALGAYASVNVVTGWFGVIDTLAFPLLAAAAAMNWYRYRYQMPQAQ